MKSFLCLFLFWERIANTDASTCLSFCFGRNILKQVAHSERSEDSGVSSMDRNTKNYELRDVPLPRKENQGQDEDMETFNVLIDTERSLTDDSMTYTSTEVTETTRDDGVDNDLSDGIPGHSRSATPEDGEVIDLRTTLEEIRNDELLRGRQSTVPDFPRSRSSTPEEFLDVRASLDEMLDKEWDKVL
jgi:hypothetical protein